MKTARKVSPERLLKLSNALDNSAREVAYRVSHVACNLPVDRAELAHYFTILQDDVKAIGKALKLEV